MFELMFEELSFQGLVVVDNEVFHVWNCTSLTQDFVDYCKINGLAYVVE